MTRASAGRDLGFLVSRLSDREAEVVGDGNRSEQDPKTISMSTEKTGDAFLSDCHQRAAERKSGSLFSRVRHKRDFFVYAQD
jgi:hypothetical protein